MKDSESSALLRGGKLITCILPDDGNCEQLLLGLLHDKKIARVQVLSCMGMGSLICANAKFGTSPDTFVAKLVRVVVSKAEAGELFDYICEKANIGREGGGLVQQSALAEFTPYLLPADVSEEEA